MPIYEFACLDCGKDFSLTLTLREYEHVHAVCPHCKSTVIERLVTSCEVVTARKS